MRRPPGVVAAIGNQLGYFELLESNRQLLQVARKRLAPWSQNVAARSAEGQENGQSMCVAVCTQVDTATAKGQEVLEYVRPRPHIWVASGSTLCGQVGSPAMAEPTLNCLATSLRPGGVMVITGFTISFLTPTLIHNAGLMVEHASLPSSQVEGLDIDSGRFHLWILRKKSNAGEKAGALFRLLAL